ncbi:hypothetical protein PLICRDRAFT_379707 [Plicaturopsis crispa FD-325 SS-3]|nr:hypothetical protein PLICRDRAFT_379707 [Plicaturopsis crispa FD-325 SS-3]
MPLYFFLRDVWRAPMDFCLGFLDGVFLDRTFYFTLYGTILTYVSSASFPHLRDNPVISVVVYRPLSCPLICCHITKRQFDCMCRVSSSVLHAAVASKFNVFELQIGRVSKMACMVVG